MLKTIVQITLVNHFDIRFSSHTLFSFLHHISIVGKEKRKKKRHYL
jgi:hypothetical protein